MNFSRWIREHTFFLFGFSVCGVFEAYYTRTFNNKHGEFPVKFEASTL